MLVHRKGQYNWQMSDKTDKNFKMYELFISDMKLSPSEY